MTAQPGPATEVTPETLAEIRAGAERRAAEARNASERIRTIRAEGRSDRGLVTVWVDGSALVQDVRFSDGASSTPNILGSMLKQAHDRAVADWQRQVAAITDTVLEDQPMLRDHIQRVSAEDARAHTLQPEEQADGSERTDPRGGGGPTGRP